jgi:hypothetical protein
MTRRIELVVDDWAQPYPAATVASVIRAYGALGRSICQAQDSMAALNDLLAAFQATPAAG